MSLAFALPFPKVCFTQDAHGGAVRSMEPLSDGRGDGPPQGDVTHVPTTPGGAPEGRDSLHPTGPQ